MRCLYRVMLFAFALCCAVTGTRPADAQSVVNGDFNCSVAGWTYGGDFSWFSLNHVGSDGSGSARMVVSEGTAMYTGTAYQCIGGVEESAPYRWGSWVYISGCETNEGYVYLQLVWYPTADCTGDTIGSEPFTTVIDETMVLEWLLSDSGVRMSPVGAHSARLVLSVTRYGLGTFTAFFDGVTFERAVFVDGFESGNLSAWSTSVPQS